MENSHRKLIYTIAILLTFAVGTASAQQQAAFGPQGQGGPSMRLIDELALDEFQAAEIQAIFDEARALREEERARSFGNNEAIRTETHEAIMSMLNPDQQARFEELTQLRAERWAGGNRQNGGQRGSRTDRPAGDCTNPDGPYADCPNDGTPGGGG